MVLLVASCGRIDFDPLGRDGSSGDVVPAVAQTAAQLGTTQTTQVVLAPTAPGDLIVVATTNIDTTASLQSIDDDGSNTYVSSGATFTCGATLFGEAWYAVALASATTVTVTSAGAVRREIWIVDVTGPKRLLAAVGLDDQVGVEADNPNVAVSEPALVVSSMVVADQIGNELAPGFTALPMVSEDDAAYAVVTSPGSYGARWSVAAMMEYCGLTAAFGS